MFNQSKYTKLYFSIIDKYGNSLSGEKHHIIPTSLGGSNDESNVTKVSCKAHFILHKLLVKMVTETIHIRKMKYALWRMMNPQSKHHKRSYTVSSRDYEKMRQWVKTNMSERNPMKNPQIANLFRRKRPEQSLVATNRNKHYWETRSRKLRKINCIICSSPIETRVPNQETCSKKCGAIHFWNKRRVSVAKHSTSSDLV